MKKTAIIIGIIFVCLLVGGISLTAAFRWMDGKFEDPNEYVYDDQVLDYPLAEAIISEEEELPEQIEQIVGEDAKITYSYIYEDDSEMTTESVPYALIGMTEHEVIEAFYGWNMVSFSENLIELEKQIDSAKNGEDYILGEKDGFIAVFYDTPIKQDNIKEITQTPINALSPDEQIKLKNGITVKGRDNLVRILEDYCS